MRKIALFGGVLLCAVMATTVRAAPTGLDLLGGEWAIEGFAHVALDEWWGTEVHEADYAVNSEWQYAPGLCFGVEPYRNVYAWSSVDASLYAAAGTSGATPGNAWASADAEWVFRPYGGRFVLEVGMLADAYPYYYESFPPPGLFLGDHEHPEGMYPTDRLSITLQDVTAGIALYSFDGTAWHFWGLSSEDSWWETRANWTWTGDAWVGTFPVDPAHEYRMSVSMKSTADNDGPWGGYISGEVVPIPAPAGIVLAGVGIGLIGWLRRRGVC